MTRRSGDRFLLHVLPIALIALLIRVIYVVLYRHHQVIGDAFTFHTEGQLLADGHGFERISGNVPTAEHPPMQVVLLAFADLLGNTGFLGQELFMACIGTLTVVAVSFLGRAVGGDRLGLIAGAAAACYPLLWIVDGTLLSETPYMLMITLVLLAGYGYLRSPTPRRALLLGALIALSTLTRGEAVSLLVLLAAPLAWRGNESWRPRLLQFGAVVLAFCVVMAPWTIRNVTTFKAPAAVLIADDGDGVIGAANCPGAYYGPLEGYWDFGCFKPRPPGDESQFSAAYRKQGLHYMGQHLSRLPVVVLARLGRQFDVWRVAQSRLIQSFEGRSGSVARWGIYVYWVFGLLAIAGLVLLRRRREPLLVLAAPLIMVVLLGAAVYGATRFRVAAEPVIVVLGAVTIEAAFARLAARRAVREPTAVQ